MGSLLGPFDLPQLPTIAETRRILLLYIAKARAAQIEAALSKFYIYYAEVYTHHESR